MLLNVKRRNILLLVQFEFNKELYKVVIKLVFSMISIKYIDAKILLKGIKNC